MAQLEDQSPSVDFCPLSESGAHLMIDGAERCAFCARPVEALRRRAARRKAPEFTDQEVRRIEFLRHLRTTGRL